MIPIQPHSSALIHNLTWLAEMCTRAGASAATVIYSHEKGWALVAHHA